MKGKKMLSGFNKALTKSLYTSGNRLGCLYNTKVTRDNDFYKYAYCI